MVDRSTTQSFHQRFEEVLQASPTSVSRRTSSSISQVGPVDVVARSQTCMKHPSAKALQRFLPLTIHSEEFWLDPKHQGNKTWKDHLDINEVMLVTSLDLESFFLML
jgi:hypothetical protein